MQKCKNAKSQKCKNAKMQKCKKCKSDSNEYWSDGVNVTIVSFTLIGADGKMQKKTQNAKNAKCKNMQNFKICLRSKHHYRRHGDNNYFIS